MGYVLKSLIATACIVVIAAGAYLAWREYSTWQFLKVQQEASRNLEILRNYQEAQEKDAQEKRAAEDKIKSMRASCNAAVAYLRKLNKDADPSDAVRIDMERSVKSCLSLGVIHKDALPDIKLTGDNAK